MTSRTALCIAHYNEDLRWMGDIDSQKYDIHLVSKTVPDARIFQPQNQGFETSAYLEFIIKNYDTLPEWCVFVHGHQYSWHHEGRMQDLVNNLDIDENTPKYKNINIDIPLYCHRFITNGEDAAGYDDDPKHRDSLLVGLRDWRNCIGLGLFHPLPITAHPPNFVTRVAAQFIVHRDQIHRHPLSTYEALLHNLRTVPYDDKMKACVFEVTWCYIFTGNYNEREWMASQSKSSA